MLPAALPHSERDDFLALDHLRLDLDVHIDMSEILLQRPAGAGDGDDAGFDIDGDCIGDLELFGR